MQDMYTMVMNGSAQSTQLQLSLGLGCYEGRHTEDGYHLCSVIPSKPENLLNQKHTSKLDYFFLHQTRRSQREEV